MNIKMIIIIGFSISYGLFENLMSLRQRRKSNVTNSGDKGSLWLLYISISVGYFLSFSIGATKIGRIYHWDVFFVIGMVLIAVGLIIRILSILTLKQYFTYSVVQVENHKLIETGLYKSIRHPGYLGQLIIFLGISISLSNWLSIVLMMIPITIGYLYRIITEEKFMLEQMGENYLNYKHRTKRLIPKIY
jgi:protein-S-isoprenylcysteine O-methyltransferase Ste14